MTETRPFHAPFLETATGGVRVGDPEGTRVITDSREDVRDALFVALRGPNFDGHAFVDAALAAGAGGAVVDRRWFEGAGADRDRLLVVEDTLGALQSLARAHRARFSLPLVAITGSNGKTSTKELTAGAVASLGPVLRTRGNLNNHIGLPLTLLELNAEHRVAVTEIGLNRPGELAELSPLAAPQVAMITNVAAAHLEGLGSLHGVARAKAQIVTGLARDGVLVIPAGSPELRDALAGYRGSRLTFGPGADADVAWSRLTLRGLDGFEMELTDGTSVRSSLLGEHAAVNTLAAIAAARALGVSSRDAARGVANVTAIPGRLSVRRGADLVILDDSYNANPASLLAALELLRAQHAPRWAVLGDMLELGAQAQVLHTQAGGQAGFLEGLVTVGTLGKAIGRGAIEAGLDPSRVHAVDTGAQAGARVAAHAPAGAVVLVKGSRGMRLETAVDAMLDARGGNS